MKTTPPLNTGGTMVIIGDMLAQAPPNQAHVRPRESPNPEETAADGGTARRRSRTPIEAPPPLLEAASASYLSSPSIDSTEDLAVNPFRLGVTRKESEFISMRSLDAREHDCSRLRDITMNDKFGFTSRIIARAARPAVQRPQHRSWNRWTRRRSRCADICDSGVCVLSPIPGDLY